MITILIPARVGSVGIPGKNFRPLAGKSPLQRAYECAKGLTVDPLRIIISTDLSSRARWAWLDPPPLSRMLARPAALATDAAPMLQVVQHALQQFPGDPDDLWLLLQPTQPLRRADHLHQALTLLTRDVDSVVSVVEVTRRAGVLVNGYLQFPGENDQRQDVAVEYERDGTVYAFWQRTVDQFGSLYGPRCVPLVLGALESVKLDTPDDWVEAERRLRDRP